MHFREGQLWVGFWPGALGLHGQAVARGSELLDGPDCRRKVVLVLLGRDRLVVAVVNDDVHTWLGHAAGKRAKHGSQWLYTQELASSIRPNKEPLATNTANRRRPKSRTSRCAIVVHKSWTTVPAQPTW